MMAALQRNNLRWEAQKTFIQKFYILEDHTLKETMEYFQQHHCFNARYCHINTALSSFTDEFSERKWKDKLKEWTFEKNIPSKEMYFMAAKAEKRRFEEGKLTLFARAGIAVDKSKVEQFKRRRLISGHHGLVVPGQ